MVREGGAASAGRRWDSSRCDRRVVAFVVILFSSLSVVVLFFLRSPSEVAGGSMPALDNLVLAWGKRGGGGGGEGGE